MNASIPAAPDVLNYILTVFPPELAALEQLAAAVRNDGQATRRAIDVEPVLVTCLWMRRVLRHAREGQLDVTGVFELSACLAKEMPKVSTRKIHTSEDDEA